MIISLADTLTRGKILNSASGGFDSGGFDGVEAEEDADGSLQSPFARK